MPSVLLIEDNENIRKIYHFALEKEQFEVVEASTVYEALGQVESRQFDIVILDMLLDGGSSGLDFLRQYDFATKSPRTKIIGLSNIDSSSVVERATEMGVSGYLNKADTEPYQLVAYLRQAMSGPTRVQSDPLPVAQPSAEE